MSVSSRIIVGLTVEFGTKLTAKDFEKCHALLDKHPEIDDFTMEELDGNLVFIYDGMSSQYARLVQVEKCTSGHIGHDSKFIELPMPGKFNPTLLAKMSELYKEYTGEDLSPKQIKYGMWTQWY